MKNSMPLMAALLATSIFTVGCNKNSTGTGAVSNPLTTLAAAADGIPDEDNLKTVLADHFNSMPFTDVDGSPALCAAVFTIGPPVISDHKPLTSDGMDMEVDVNMTLKSTSSTLYPAHPAENCTAQYPTVNWLPGQTFTSRWLVHMEKWENGWRFGNVL